MRRRRARAAALAAFAAAAALGLALSGCGVEPPSIVAVEWRLEARPSDPGPRYESLSAFALVKGGAQEGAIEELWIVNDAEELAWKLASDDWIKKDEGANAWIGGAPFAMSDLSPLPRGEYRAVAVDPAGERAERSFVVAGEFPARASPSVSLDNNGVALASSWPENLVLAFDGAGELVASVAAPAKRAALSSVLGQAQAGRSVEIQAYGYDPDLRMGAFSPRRSLK